MSSALTMPEIGRTRRLMAAAAVLCGTAAGAAGHWKAAVGLVTGLAAMGAAVELARMRAATLEATSRAQSARLLNGLLQVAKYVVALAVFWLVLNVVKVPLWSVCIGVTAGVACLIAGFLVPRRQPPR